MLGLLACGLPILLMLRQALRQLGLGNTLNPAQQFVGNLRHIELGAQLLFQMLQQTGSHLGIGKRPVRPPCPRQVGKLDQVPQGNSA